MLIKNESIFVNIYFPKPKSILLDILNGPPNKSDKSDHLIKHINDVFTGTGALDNQECYLQGDLNINLLLHKKETFSIKTYRKKWPKLVTSNKRLSKFLLLLFFGTINFGTN